MPTSKKNYFKEAAEIMQENNNEGNNQGAILFEPSVSHQCVLPI